MKPAFMGCILLMLAGCVSERKSDYQYTTADNLRKMASEIAVQEQVHSTGYLHEWRYAGSDKEYDYVYLYQAGVCWSFDFHYYKTNAGALNFKKNHIFSPDLEANEYVFGEETEEAREEYWDRTKPGWRQYWDQQKNSNP